MSDETTTSPEPQEPVIDPARLRSDLELFVRELIARMEKFYGNDSEHVWGRFKSLLAVDPDSAQQHSLDALRKAIDEFHDGWSEAERAAIFGGWLLPSESPREALLDRTLNALGVRWFLSVEPLTHEGTVADFVPHADIPTGAVTLLIKPGSQLADVLEGLREIKRVLPVHWQTLITRPRDFHGGRTVPLEL